MSRLSGKIIETHIDENGESDFALGKRLRALRELTGMTKKEVSAKLGISQATLSKLEARAISSSEIGTHPGSGRLNDSRPDGKSRRGAFAFFMRRLYSRSY